MHSRAETVRRELLTRLATLPLFAGLDAASLSDLASAMQYLALPGGSGLFEQGEESDALYVLLYGRLAAVRHSEDGQRRTLGTVAPGECVGEIGLIAKQPRSASVFALRDSELLRLPRPAFEKLVAMHPAAMLSMARIALRRSDPRQGGPAAPRCFALLAAGPGLDLRAFGVDLARTLGADAERCLVTAEMAADRDAGWFNAHETRSHYLIYLGNDDPEWQERCLRQSDCLLLLANGDAIPPAQAAERLPAGNPHVPQHLVLRHVGEPLPGSTAIWRNAFPQVQAHHHVRGADDLARLARRLNGRAVGLVLSGGGARGFAHLGVVRALREAGVPIDYLGGASIGAILGAGIAADWPHEQALAVFRRSFVDTNPMSDWTLPLVALNRGRKVSRLLRDAYGTMDIEDLPLPYLCVSSNLTAGTLEVHERGPLWSALRASCAIPGVLPPVFGGGRVLVDGGVIDNLPVAEVRKRLAGELIAVDVGGNYRLETMLHETELPPWWRLLPEFFGHGKHPGIGHILLRAGMVNSAATVQRRRKQTRLLLKPALPGIDLLSWREFERAMRLGYDYTRRRLDEAPETLAALTAAR